MSKINNKIQCSVIVPVYNQYNSLCKVLPLFNHQRFPLSQFEVILVDDGSTDELKNICKEDLTLDLHFHFHMVKQQNSGRAAARNAGVRHAQGKRLIFCDVDRLPHPGFIQEHMHESTGIIVGASYDFFGNHKVFDAGRLDWPAISKSSRLSAYQKKVTNMYGQTRESQSPLAWLGFLVGNASMPQLLFYQAGCFNIGFNTWGFEHFELALRCQLQGASFSYNPHAMNYHIPHPREHNFYTTMIQKNCQFLQTIYPTLNTALIERLLLTDLPFSEAEKEKIGIVL